MPYFGFHVFIYPKSWTYIPIVISMWYSSGYPLNYVNILIFPIHIYIYIPHIPLVGGLEHFYTFFIFHILGMIILTDELIFFRGVAQPATRVGWKYQVLAPTGELCFIPNRWIQRFIRCFIPTFILTMWGPQDS